MVGDHLRQDGYDHGPISENGSTAAGDVRLSALDEHGNQSLPTAYGSEPGTRIPQLRGSDVVAPGPYESDGKSVESPLIQELSSPPIYRQELPEQNEIHELGPTRSLRDAKDSTYRLTLPRDLPLETPQPGNNGKDRRFWHR